MAGKVEVVALAAERIAKRVEQRVEVEVLVGIVEKDPNEPSVRLSAEVAAAAQTLPKMDQFASVVVASAAV